MPRRNACAFASGVFGVPTLEMIVRLLLAAVPRASQNPTVKILQALLGVLLVNAAAQPVLLAADRRDIELQPGFSVNIQFARFMPDYRCIVNKDGGISLPWQPLTVLPKSRRIRDFEDALTKRLKSELEREYEFESVAEKEEFFTGFRVTITVLSEKPLVFLKYDGEQKPTPWKAGLSVADLIRPNQAILEVSVARPEGFSDEAIPKTTSKRGAYGHLGITKFWSTGDDVKDAFKVKLNPGDDVEIRTAEGP